MGRGLLRKILGADEVRALLRAKAPKQRWMHIGQLHDLLKPHFLRAAPRLARAKPSEFDARRKHDLRNLLQKERQAGHVSWDEATESYLVPAVDAEVEDALLQPDPPTRLRAITPAQLKAAREALERLGSKGEEIVDDYLKAQKSAGALRSYRWVSRTSADAPFDFEVTLPNGRKKRVEVKTTGGNYRQRFRLSYAQVKEMAKGGDFEIWRVSDVTPRGATLRVSLAVRRQARRILEICEDLGNVRAAVFVVPPTEFDFGPPVAIP